jgi:hypothetical protein
MVNFLAPVLTFPRIFLSRIVLSRKIFPAKKQKKSKNSTPQAFPVRCCPYAIIAK